MDMSQRSGGGGNDVETVGSLLAVIAIAVQDALRTLMYADKSAWASAEFEQLRLLEDTIDEAKRDFQKLPTLFNGTLYYQNDRNVDSLEELRELCTRFREHAQTLKAWARAGGPIEPEWAIELRWLRRELHRAQCRAARRIRDDLETSSIRPRCLGALIVQQSQEQPQMPPISTATTAPTTRPRLEPSGEISACNSTGTFQRVGPGNRDIAFVCDFCDGFLIWEDLRSMPSTRLRAASSAAEMMENWAAAGFAHPHQHHDEYMAASVQDSDIELEDGAGLQNGNTDRKPTGPHHPATEEAGQEKTIVFPPVAIANHLPPEPGEWQAPLLCPLCDDYYYEEQGDDDMDRIRYTQDEHGFESVAKLQEHLEWSHGSMLPSLSDIAPQASKCVVM
ncbi:hypothetical protein F5Y17DRAFT_96717 [Xylariaceae sp. FL0594]|nr:hypothetical protein F5Y17DRAFT_96717 [Xylariaceae sp. FL0594]